MTITDDDLTLTVENLYDLLIDDGFTAPQAAASALVTMLPVGVADELPAKILFAGFELPPVGVDRFENIGHVCAELFREEFGADLPNLMLKVVDARG